MSLLDLRKQIATTISTRAITKAMQLVAANKMKHFVKEANTARGYLAELETGYKQVAGLSEATNLTVPTGKTLFFLFTSDKGLCGALNVRVIKTLVQSDIWKATAPEDRIVIAFGRKGFEQAKRLKFTVDKSILRAPEKLNATLAWKLFGDMLDKILTGQTKDAYAAHPVYENAFSFKTTVSCLTADLKPDKVAGATPQGPAARAIIEPSPEAYLSAVRKRMMVAKIITCVAELKATEYSSRMMAMQKATDSAGERISTLTMAYHKARQTLITQELAELSAAGEAMTSPYGHEIPLIHA